MGDSESYVTCPYNSAHRILRGRFQTHLFKCRKNYPNAKRTCPFDSSHVIDPEKFQNHISACPSSANLQSYRDTVEPPRQIGTISIAEACGRVTNMIQDGDWIGNNPTYNPLAESEKKPVFRTAIGLSKSKKKEFKEYERQRIRSLENGNSGGGTSKQPPNIRKKEEPLRMPRNIIKSLLTEPSTNNSAESVIPQLNDLSLNTTTDEQSSVFNHTNTARENQENVLSISDNKIDISPNKNNPSHSKGKENITSERKNIDAIRKTGKTGAKEHKASISISDKEDLESDNIEKGNFAPKTCKKQLGVNLSSGRKEPIASTSCPDFDED